VAYRLFGWLPRLVFRFRRFIHSGSSKVSVTSREFKLNGFRLRSGYQNRDAILFNVEAVPLRQDEIDRSGAGLRWHGRSGWTVSLLCV